MQMPTKRKKLSLQVHDDIVVHTLFFKASGPVYKKKICQYFTLDSGYIVNINMMILYVLVLFSLRASGSVFLQAHWEAVHLQPEAVASETDDMMTELVVGWILIFL